LTVGYFESVLTFVISYVHHVLETFQPLDLKLLLLITESLTAKSEDLDKTDSRKRWSDRVRTFSPLVHQLLDSVNCVKYTDPVNHCR